MANPVQFGGFISRAERDPKADADARHVRHFGGGDRKAVGQARDVVHRARGLQPDLVTVCCSAEYSGHDFGRADAPFVFEDNVNGLLRIVGYFNEVEVSRTDELVTVKHAGFHPAQQALPE